MLDLLAESGFTNMTGLDIASDREGNLLKNGKSWRYLAASATRFPLREASFDWVLCAHSLHHLWPVENIESFLSEARRCLKPGGTLSLIDHYDSIQMRFALQVLLSPLACLTEWTRLFRQQHLEEKEQLYGYLNQWKAVDRLIRQAGFSEVIFKRDLFFFYCTAVK